MWLQHWEPGQLSRLEQQGGVGIPGVPWGTGDSMLGTTTSPGMPGCFLATAALLSSGLQGSGSLTPLCIPSQFNTFLGEDDHAGSSSARVQQQAGQGLGTGRLYGLSLAREHLAHLLLLWPSSPPAQTLAT